MRRSLLRIALIVGTLFLVAGTERATAQAYPFKEGIAAATKKAQDTLAQDAILVGAGTVGDMEFSGIQLTFDLQTGNATVWVYLFYSPSLQKTMPIAVIKLFVIYQAMGIGEIPLPIPDGLTKAMDMAGQYLNSNQMVKRLETDTAYQRFRSELPGAKPSFLSVAELGDFGDLPNDFPLTQPIWSVVFSGENDSTMTCFVGANTGSAFCRRISQPTTAVPGSGIPGSDMSLTVLPNPAHGSLSVGVRLPDGKSLPTDARMGLYNLRGEQVLDLSPVLAGSNGLPMTFPTSALPSGNYYVRLHGQGVQPMTIPVAVEQ